METSINNKCKAFTSLEQSKKLAEILPLESADMWYHGRYSPWGGERRYDSEPSLFRSMTPNWDKPCWSLSALLDYLSANFRVTIKYLDNHWELDCIVHVEYCKELIDACYKMIIRLNELKML